MWVTTASPGLLWLGAVSKHNIFLLLEGFQFAWDFLVAVVLIIQKLAEEWPGLHVCVKTPCRTSGCPAEFLWPDMDGAGAMYVHAVPLQARAGPGWSLLQCWWGWSASKSHVKLVMKFTGTTVSFSHSSSLHSSSCPTWC